jgi:hypothetical protein
LGIALKRGMDRGVLVNLAGVVPKLPFDIEWDLHVLDVRVVHADQLDKAD